MSLLVDIGKLPSPSGSKEFLSSVKKILQDFKALYSSETEDGIRSNLACLVQLYLTCPCRLPAKRAMASFFQGLEHFPRQECERQLCRQMKECMDFASINEDDRASNLTTRRLCVDNINSLMENFKLGETCLFNIFVDVLTFMVRSETQFLSGFGPEVPPVGLNEVMLNCHVTMQTINLLLQKANAESCDKIIQLQSLSQCLNDLMNLDLQIIHNDLFLLDCRCCCAMNAILLLQLTLPMDTSTFVIPSILFPGAMEINKTDVPTWLTDAQISCLSLDSTKPLTFLALTFGYVAMVTASGIVHKPKVFGNYFYIDVLLPHILHVGTSCEDTPSKALYAKTVNLWTSRLLLAMDQTTLSEQLASKLRGQSSRAISSLLDYVWTHWEDTLGVVHQSCKTVFENTLKLHVKACFATGEDSSPFILSLVDKVLAVSWTSRGKSGALISCVNYVGTGVLLHMRPSLPGEVLQQLQEQAISCYASELYSCLFLSYQRECASSLSSKDSQDLSASEDISFSKSADRNEDVPAVLHSTPQMNLMDTWIHPIIKAMLSNHTKLKQNIIEYLLPKLLKNNADILDFMIEEMSSTTGSKSAQNLANGAIIMCLRRARVIGLLKSKPQASPNELWFGILHRSILQSALCNLNEQIRLDAFALLCENCKTSEAISFFEFEMLQSFIPYNVNSQSPAFRQTFLSLMKKFFFRLKESLGLLNRQKTKQNSSPSEALIKTYHSFLSWLTIFLLDNIYPGSTFARRNICLACLSLLTSFFTGPLDGFSVANHLTQDHLQKFLECLTDTFEENRKEALGMLTIYTDTIGMIGTPKCLETLLAFAFSLACSTKPQDCESAAYLFILLLKQPIIWQVLRDYCMPLQSDKMKLKLEFINSTFRSSTLFSSESEEIVTACSSRQLGSSLYLLDLLCVFLNDQIEQAQNSLVAAAASRPMYSTLHCIRYILRNFDWSALTRTFLPLAKDFIKNLIHSCLDLAKVVSPVVQNSSPEGNVPADAILRPDLNMSDLLHSLDIKDSDKAEASGTEANRLAQSIALSQMLVEAMPEYLVVCCWRSIKEVSLVLGKLCQQIPVVRINENSDTTSDSHILPSLLSLDQIETIGQYFRHQLLESIHRGAFELAYTGFQLMCQMLWIHPLSAFYKLPPQWLQQVLTDIQSPQSKLCATRRSAGVPFFVQAVTSTEPSAVGRKCFHSCIKELISLATGQRSAQDGCQDAQVHALNILRTLYRDAKLGEEVVPYIAEGLKAAILGFKSDLWGVRNSATLLLSSLMTRIFGVKRSKDEGDMSKKNCQTGRAFFHRYPSLYPFLLNELESATASVGQQDITQLHPSLYPILLVLGRLFPSTLEGSDTSLSLSAFIPFVLKCSASPVYKTRIMAARALQPLAIKSQVTDIIEKLVNTIPASALHCISSSHIHGSLLQLQQLFKLVFDLNDTLKEKAIRVFVSRFLPCSWLLSSHNTCCATRQGALKLVDSVLDIARSINLSKGGLEVKVKDLELQFISSLTDSSTDTTLHWNPFFYELEKTRACLCIKHLPQFVSYEGAELQQDTLFCRNDEDKWRGNDDAEQELNFTFRQKILKDLLTSPFYEARLEALKGMLIALETQPHSASMKERGADDKVKDGFMPSFSESEERETEWADECEEINEISSKSSYEAKALMTKLSISLFDSILTMAMEHEGHPECVEKLFYLLAAIPECTNLLRDISHTNLMKVFISVIEKIGDERRTEVKAAMLRFSSRIVPLVIEMTNSAKPQEEMEYVMQWIKIQTSYSRDDSNPDLQLSVSFSFLENATILLSDPHQKLGAVSLLCWDVMAILLQAEEPDVKIIAASAVAVACGQHADAFHPNYALHKLPEFLISLKSDLGFHKLFQCLVSWILLDESCNEKEIEERLFERGEINTYWDHISFSCSVTIVLVQLIQSLQSKSSSLSSSYKNDLTQVKDFCEATTAKYVHELELFTGDNKTPNLFTNPGKYTGVYVTVSCAEYLRQIFYKCHKCLGTSLPSQYLSLEDLIVNVKKKLHIICE